MIKLFLILNLMAVLVTPSSSFANILKKTDAVRENLVGPVKNVRVEIAKINKVNGAWVEAPPMPWLSTFYDPQGHRVKEVQIYTNPALDFTSIFTRDEQGLLLDGVEYNAAEEVAFTWTYSHDPSLSHIEEQRFQPEGTFFSKTTYDYDLLGNLKEENRFPPHTQNHFKWVYKYNAAGQQIEEAHFLLRSGIRPGHLEKSLNSRRLFEYDKKGRIQKETRYDGSGKIVNVKTFKYTFDQVGNWVSQTALESLETPGKPPFVPTEITHRKITYHP